MQAKNTIRMTSAQKTISLVMFKNRSRVSERSCFQSVPELNMRRTWGNSTPNRNLDFRSVSSSFRAARAFWLDPRAPSTSADMGKKI